MSQHRLIKTKLCCVPGCGRVYSKMSMCSMHYQRTRKYGSPHTNYRPSNPDGYVGAGGYVVICRDGRKQYKHKYLAEKALGRPLPKGAVIHHVTEDRTDNDGPFKLIVCPNRAYHDLIHRLMREKRISFKTGWPNGPVSPSTAPRANAPSVNALTQTQG